MAHKGKLYPYLFQRDLSLTPFHRWGLPDRYTWITPAATGTYAYLFNGVVRDSTKTYVTYQMGAAQVVYEFEFLDASSQKWFYFLQYELLASVVQSRMRITNQPPVAGGTAFAWQNTLPTWPHLDNLPYNNVQWAPGQLFWLGSGVWDPKVW